MPRLTILTVVIGAVLCWSTASLRAEHGQALGRHLGIGWGDGYHSRTACPPKRVMPRASAVPLAAPSKQVPWWMIPASEPENVPVPAPTEGDAASGQSRSRQPGEGSSNFSPSGPSIMR